MILDSSTKPSGTTHVFLRNMGNERPSKMSRVDLSRRISQNRLDLATGLVTPYPFLSCVSEFEAWIERVEADLTAWGIPESHWSDAAILLLADSASVNMAMRQQRSKREEDIGISVWSWDEFKLALARLLDERDSRTGMQTFREDFPAVSTAATVAGAGLVVAGGAVLVPAIAIAGLNAFGFTAAGVAGGSAAAGLQSAVFGGFTTGLFSLCQSIGATSVVASAGSIISAIGITAGGATIIAASQAEDDDPDPSGQDGPSSNAPPPPPYQRL
ncbi:hypothetical protein B0H34DRAFT_793131 [Crassisporium funariophilum]|nr:hypothetical protein B0H34DRAFT_793131 [Crassisporium funariophilum]